MRKFILIVSLVAVVKAQHSGHQLVQSHVVHERPQHHHQQQHHHEGYPRYRPLIVPNIDGHHHSPVNSLKSEVHEGYAYHRPQNPLKIEPQPSHPHHHHVQTHVIHNAPSHHLANPGHHVQNYPIPNHGHVQSHGGHEHHQPLKVLFVPAQQHHQEPKGHAVSSQSLVSHHQPVHQHHGHDQSYASPLGHYQTPQVHHSGPVHYVQPHHSSLGHHDDQYHHHPAYKFEYSVHDDHTKDIKSHSETRDGDKVEGRYSLLQPDGHVRNVIYRADKHSGFNAEVSYSHQNHHK